MVSKNDAGFCGKRRGLYKSTRSESRVGDLTAAWSRQTTPPDRRLHVKGIFPRGGALAASSLAIWTLVRALILMVDPAALSGAVWIFDILCLGLIAGMLHSLPRRRKGSRDYGRLPWIALFALICTLALAFGVLRGFAATYGITGFIPAPWLAGVALVPLLAAVAMLAWQLMSTRDDGEPLEAIDRLAS